MRQNRAELWAVGTFIGLDPDFLVAMYRIPRASQKEQYLITSPLPGFQRFHEKIEPALEYRLMIVVQDFMLSRRRTYLAAPGLATATDGTRRF
jgi:hypothetical protein